MSFAELTKREIRSKILLRLKTQKEDDRERKSRLILKKLLKQKEFIKAKAVMFYIALDGEVNTREMIEQAKRLGKIITVPVVQQDAPRAPSKAKTGDCRKNRISMRPCVLDEHAALKKGPYGVSEPAIERPVHLKDLDLVVVPGIAFNRNGGRLGRGKGCYDRFLKRLPEDTPSIGLAFDFQVLPHLPTTVRDVDVKKVLFA